jgi:hypothetical protein
MHVEHPPMRIDGTPETVSPTPAQSLIVANRVRFCLKEDGTCALEIRADGTCFVRGIPVDGDAEVLRQFRLFFASITQPVMLFLNHADKNRPDHDEEFSRLLDDAKAVVGVAMKDWP